MTAVPPPLPPRSAAEAAAATSPAAAASAPYDPATDVDDTGVPTNPGRSFLSALFDVSFRTFITRRLASAFYVVGLVAIAMAFLIYFVGGIVNGVVALSFNAPAGIALLVSTVIIVPIAAFLAVVLLRFVIEAVVALIAIAENTERTAANTRD